MGTAGRTVVQLPRRLKPREVATEACDDMRPSGLLCMFLYVHRHPIVEDADNQGRVKGALRASLRDLRPLTQHRLSAGRWLSVGDGPPYGRPAARLRSTAE